MVLSHPAYTEYEVSSNSKVFCLWFIKSCISAAELRIKSSSKLYQNKPKFYICCDLTTNIHNINFQLIRRWFAYSSLKVVFLQQNWTSN